MPKYLFACILAFTLAALLHHGNWSAILSRSGDGMKELAAEVAARREGSIVKDLLTSSLRDGGFTNVLLSKHSLDLDR
jgi:hypothetical protein